MSSYSAPLTNVCNIGSKVNSSCCVVVDWHLYINLRSRDCLRSFIRDGRPSDLFSSLWAAFTLTVHINALCNESIHGKEEHAT